MNTAYFDCFAGISGDMVISALIDSGLDFSFIEKTAESLGIGGYEISAEKTLKNGIACTSFKVLVKKNQPHRRLSDITDIIMRSGLTESVKNNSIAIFNKIAKAEAQIHVKSIEEIHFHEIGAVDSIIDICSAAAAIDEMKIQKIISSPLNTGKGFVKTAHGELPVPAPATAEILKGIPVYSTDTNAELTTPTGAAIIAHYAALYTPMPEMKINSIGYGAGSRDLDIPNLLRIYIGETSAKQGILSDEVIEIETSIDDMNPEFYSYLFNVLLDAGALDVALIPVFMKKNRPGHILKVITPPAESDSIISRIFTETSTSGVRVTRTSRKILTRKTLPVETPYGVINVKVHVMNGKAVTISPEYEECRIIAMENDIPLKNVYNSALQEANKII
ncbi:MAG TPA: nickel pincer cofactor biosynthesis protein LarC [Spirochaetota bacterium]|nr:nickel pincer cofactor biosynthesis protein LarC [Spirochaetota bacterium]HPJ42444.1 nickel pincer cofactor biosynthesis protein LarC [Spirochaetota bacterium]HPR37226.1 nickel pincer cofactor biosynthesis protein LarC [Spirochaetota bacterium]